MYVCMYCMYVYMYVKYVCMCVYVCIYAQSDQPELPALSIVVLWFDFHSIEECRWRISKEGKERGRCD